MDKAASRIRLRLIDKNGGSTAVKTMKNSFQNL